MAVLSSDGVDKMVLVDVLRVSDLIVTHMRWLNGYSEVLK